ncbi:MAG: hypothetical protein D6713_04615 [Deltaproteobacteria bacterium]|nr:MAG: hypothetical protein D6713_04615 [Deltaproteobacteria bacterium]
MSKERGIFLIVFFLALSLVFSGCSAKREMVKDSPVKPENSSREAKTEGGGKVSLDSAKTEGTDAYRIGPGDVLHISVWNNEELTQDVMVRPDGKISLPLIQDVTAEGFTTEELKKIIEVRLKEFIIEPVVTVVVREVNYPKFFIMGEVAHPGTYPLREKLTLLQAISVAGGFTQFASPSRIVLIRRKGNYQEKVTVNYYKILKSNPGEENVILKPGDTIIVP